MKPILRLIPFFIVFGVMSVLLALPVVGQTPQNRQLYMPVAGRAILAGPVFTIVGYGPADLILTLDFFDGVTTTEFMSTTRSSAGVFIFDKLPLLEPGQYYQVSYYNGRYGPVDENYAILKKAPRITSSVAGGAVGGNHIYPTKGQIRLRSPSDGRQYAFSSPLAWDYGSGWFYITFYDLQGNEVAETEPVLSDGGIGHEAYLLPFPPELAFDTPYMWEVSIRNPDGSELIDNSARREIIFVAEEPLPAPTGLRNECYPADKWEEYYCDYSWDSLGEGTEYSLWGGDAAGWTTNTTVRLRNYCAVPHRWHVRARTATGESTWSEMAATQPPACPPPCDSCMPERFNEQPAWQPNGRIILRGTGEVTKKLTGYRRTSVSSAVPAVH